MNKKQIILLAVTATGLYLVLRGLKKDTPKPFPLGENFNNYIGSQGQGTYFNANGTMSLDNLVRSYKRP